MTRLSNRQFPMLQVFIEIGHRNDFMSIEDAQTFDQRPFRSMLIQQWVAFKPGHGFHVTKLGEEAMKEFLGTDIGRKNIHAPLTAYFDPDAKRKARGAA